MYGAICGDIIGSRFEFDRGPWTTEFELFTKECDFTDDTVMTIAVAEGLINAGPEASVEEVKKSIIDSMKKWGRLYPHAGYGAKFIHWIFDENPKPYGSWGNGSAMRVSAAGWIYDSLERTLEVARATAEVSHNHKEGIKGAECTAAVIYLGRTGKSKEEIEEYVSKEFGYDLSESLEEMRKRHRHDESCMDALPKALKSFFCGDSYEAVVRNAVSLGGDTDTIAAIAGAMAEALYGMPIVIEVNARTYLTEEMLSVVDVFSKITGKPEEHHDDDNYENNKFIKMAVEQLYEDDCKESFFQLLYVLLKRMEEEGEAPTPMVEENNAMADIDVGNLKVGDTLSLEHDLRFRMETMKDHDDKLWFPLFTDYDEIYKGDTSYINMNMSIESILRSGFYSERVEGVVINPFGQAVTLNKEILGILLDQYDESLKEKNQ